MPDLLIRNLDLGTVAWLKAKAAAHGRSISDEAKVVIIRRLWRDGAMPIEEAEADLRALNAELQGDD